MKNLSLLVVFTAFFLSCEKTDVNEETKQLEEIQKEFYSIDKGDVVRPGDKPG